MPYIKKADRLSYDMVTQSLPVPDGPGDLNYVITQLCRHYAKKHGKRYATYNAIVGVLECAKLEFYRRAVAAYEDDKIKENGDVY